MRYLFTVLTDQPAPATPSEAKAIDAFNDTLRRDGYWVFAGGLEDPHQRVLSDQRARRTGEESSMRPTLDWYAAGLWILDVPNEGIAERLVHEASAACNRKVEARRFL